MNDASKNTDYLDFLEDDFEVMRDDRHPAVTQIESHLPTISKLSLVAKNISVESVEERKVAFDVTADIKNIYKTIEELRKKAIEPARRIVQMINDAAKGLQEILSVAESEVKLKIASFQKQQEEVMRAAQESVKALSEQLGVEILIPIDVGPKSSKASSYYKETLSFEIVDKELVPDEYWMIDEDLLQTHINLGKKDIPGVTITKDKKFIVRRK